MTQVNICCLSCSAVCPTGALTMALPVRPHLLTGWRFSLLIIMVFVLGIAGGMLSGHWKTRLSYADYQRLIPSADMLGH